MSASITEFFIQGMKCGGCISNAEKALAGVPGFVSAEFNLDAGTAKVVGGVDPQAVCQVLTEAGYPAVVKSG
ncbi:MAG: heavy-metal-associated domain-containing protein [Gammaproteobacteria bacterium]|nr:heavy-metal-associated domain-containing protein [Gammaproteobacteria bacterium]MCF6362828.1 heavy-metal-associated domain-containing protein [Gammaproteobacteria bacterium]